MGKVFKSVNNKEGYTKIVDNSNSDLKYIEMGMLNFEKVGAFFEMATGHREFGINILSGVIKLKVVMGKSQIFEFEKVGSRLNLFSGPPAMVYLPTNSTFSIEIVQPPFSAVVYSAPADIETVPRVINPNEIITVRTGELNWTRFVRVGISDNIKADKLIIGETLAPSGNWTSYPSHKHDERNPPFEKPSEEVYSFYFDKPGGFAMIRIYTPKEARDPLDEAYVMNDGGVVAIGRGYHPIAVAPGYRCCYLFCLAGEERNYGAWSDDPEHSWIRGCETVIQGNELL